VPNCDQRALQIHIGPAAVAFGGEKVGFSLLVHLTLPFLLLRLQPLCRDLLHAAFVASFLGCQISETFLADSHLLLCEAILRCKRKCFVAAFRTENVATLSAVMPAQKEAELRTASLAILHKVILHP
jgi:hypothetical protein